MGGRFIKALGYAILTVAAVVSLAFVNVLKPNGLGAAASIALWLVLPYAALALGLAFFANERASAIAYVAVIALVTAGGGLFLTYVIFLRPDPQGGIAVLFTPVYQAVGMAILVPACRWLMGKRA
jgi:hypothetical protein